MNDATQKVWSEPPKLPPPPLTCFLCFLIGHRWAHHVKRDDEPTKGYRIIARIELKACARCGVPNPNYQEPA